MGLKRYMLVRVALDVREEEWFGEKLKRPEAGDTGAEVPSQKAEDFMPVPWGIRRFLSGLSLTGREKKRQKRQEQLQRQQEIQQRAANLAEQEALIRRTEMAIEKLASVVWEYVGEENRCFCVYEGSVRKALKGKQECTAAMPIGTDGFEGEKKPEGSRTASILPMLWQQSFPQEEFAAYSSRFWVEQLMPRAVLPHYVILGYADCIPEILENYAVGMKSLQWILTEADNTEELQEFVEDFYLETGLAISLQTIPDAGEFSRLRLHCALPSNILDFTRESRPRELSGVAKGSIWLDMQSMEEKQRQIQGRGMEIAYFSMKEMWKYAQRRCNAPVLP